MSLVSRILGSIEAHRYLPRFRFFRTVYANFRLLPFSQAIKLPIYIYGRLHLWKLNGKVELDVDDVRPGMIRIGNVDPFSLADNSGFLSLASPESRLVFEGPCRIGANCKIHLMANARVTIGKFVKTGCGIKLICNGGTIQIEDYSRIAFETVIMNSGFHSVVDLKTHTVSSHIRPIKIGRKCWIGNRCTISGGTVLKDNTIVGASSLVNADFSKKSEEFQFLAGSPAVIRKNGIARVWSPKLEMKIIEHFINNGFEGSYSLGEETDNIHDIELEY